MVRSIWSKTLVSAVACAGLASAQQPTVSPNPPTVPAPASAQEQFVTVQETGKPAQRCKVISSWKTADGATAYKVKALDTGEILTIIESGAATTGTQPGRRMQTVAMRIFHWGRDNNPPAGVPMAPNEVVRTSPPVVGTQQYVVPSTTAPANDAARRWNQTPATANTTSGTPSDPSDWRKSWGQSSEPPRTTTSALAGGVRDISLPHSDSKRPDPLQMPEDYRSRMSDIVPTTKKQDSTKTDDDKSKPKTTTSYLPSLQPIPVADSTRARTASESSIARRTETTDRRTMQTATSSADSHEVGRVQSLSVPVVSIPEKREELTPVTQTLTQGTPTYIRQDEPTARGRTTWPAATPAPAPLDPSVVNAFSHVPTTEEVVRGSNAFATMPSGPVNLPSGNMHRGQYPNYANAMAMARTQSMMANPAVQGTAQWGYQTETQAMAVSHSATSGLGTQPISPESKYWLDVLHDSLYPSQREWAAETLSALDWKSNPKVVQAMVAGAREDPAATVRAACVRCLTKMKANSKEVLAAIAALKNDTDPRVRQEADQAILALATTSFSAPASVQRAAYMPGSAR
jgi:hypothetical protein